MAEIKREMKVINMFEKRLQGFTYADIAKEAGISRQRVHQLISPPLYVKKVIFAKYSNMCADCGILVRTSGHIHHENHDLLENYNDLENLILLCCSCHLKRHSQESRERELIRYGTLERNKQICQLYAGNIPMLVLAQVFRISRERIRQIVKRGEEKI